MTDKEKIIHDLAMIHASEKYHELFELVPASGRTLDDQIAELENFYEVAVQRLVPHIDEIMEAYLSGAED